MKPRQLRLLKIMGVFVLILLNAGGYLYWKQWHIVPLQERYHFQALEKGDVTQTVSANGTLNPVVLVNVGTQVSGTVKKLHADFNDQVSKGQILAELDPALFLAQIGQSEANVSSAQASLELAQANEKRMRELFRQEYVSRQELDQAVQALKSARAQLALARAQLQKDRTNYGYSIIRSPVSGVVVSRVIDIGQTVAASFQTPTLFTIAQDLTRMQINSSFAEADIGYIEVGQEVYFTVDAFPRRTFRGTVRQRRLNPTTVQNVVTYDVGVEGENPERILMPGMTAYVNIITAQRGNVLLVPNTALRFKPADAAPNNRTQGSRKNGQQEKSAAATVYVLEQDRLRPVAIVPGITDNKYTEVLSGKLAAGDRVVTGEVVPSGEEGPSQGVMKMRLF